MGVKFSILIPAYNAEQYIRRCIDSILAQTYKDFEIVIIDDGSTDRTAIICNEYASKSSCLKLYSQDNNHGVSYTRNRLLENANGEWIVFVDADDYIDENYLWYFEKAIKQNSDTEVACCDIFNVYSNKELFVKCDFGSKEDYLHKMFAGKSAKRTLWAKVINKSLIYKTDVSFDEEITMGEDFLFLFQIIRNTDKIIYIPQALYYHNKNNAQSITSKAIIPMTDDKLRYLSRMTWYNDKFLDCEIYKKDIYNLYFMIYVEYFIYISKNKGKIIKKYSFPNFVIRDLFISRKLYKILISLKLPIPLRLAVKVFH